MNHRKSEVGSRKSVGNVYESPSKVPEKLFLHLSALMLLATLLCVRPAGLLAQSTVDSLPPATEEPLKRDTTQKSNWPNPKKAGLLSVIIPGAGQIYNRDYWKVPLVYGAVGGMVYAIIWNTDQYQRFQTAYQLALKKQKHEFSDTAFDNPQTLRSVRDAYDKNRQLSYVGLAFVYLLNGMEAFVDAHLRNFDISEDLTLQVRPTLGMDPVSQQPALGLGIRIPLGAYRTVAPAR